MIVSPYSFDATRFLLRQGKEAWEAKDHLVLYSAIVWYLFPGSFSGLWTLLVTAEPVPLIPRDLSTTFKLAGVLSVEVVLVLVIWLRFVLWNRPKLPPPWSSVDIAWIFQSCRTLRYTPIYGLYFLLTQFGASRHHVRRTTPWHFRHSLNLAWAAMIVFGWAKFYGIDALLLCSLTQLYLATMGLLVGQVEAVFKDRRGKEHIELNYRCKPRYALATGSQLLIFASTILLGSASNTWVTLVWLAMPPITFGTLVSYIEHAHEGDYVNPKGVIYGGHTETFCQVCEDTILTGDHLVKDTHHPTIASLVSSARNGCRICAAVWQAASHIPRDFVRDMMFWKPATKYSGHQVELNGTRISFEVRSGRVPDRWIKDVDIGNRLNLSALPYHTGSEQSLQQARKWLHNCTVFHGVCCANHDHTFRPSRLLMVDNNSICLQVVKDMPERVDYLTLSHRWGESVPLKLMELDVDRFRQNIAWSDLPRTFQDAIWITRYLGYSYIWIDSLCIIQNSKADWKHEAALMGRIYRNSACNIAASSAKDSTHGCLYPRNSRTIQPEAISYESDGTNVQYFFNGTDVYEGHIIYNRAWILQEAFLARRTLDCARGQLFWRCGEMRGSEVFPGGVPTNIYRDEHPASKFKVISADGDQVIVNANILIERLRTKKDEIHAESGKTSLEQFTDSPFAFWRHLVDHYTKLEIRFESDRIVAFDGVVDVFRPFFGEYWHGLWRIFMPAGLLWQGRGKQVSEHDVPSWSWMAIEGSVTLFSCEFKYGRDILLAAFLGLVNGDERKLRLSAFVLKGKHAYDFIHFDFPKVSARVETFCMMCVVAQKGRNGKTICGLVIEEVEGGYYKRLGYFEDTRAKLLPDLKTSGKTEIILV